MLSSLGPTRKAGGEGGGGADTKSGRGGGGVLSDASGPIQKAGRGGYSAEEGAVPYMKGGLQPPPPPPPPPPPWIRLWFDVSAGADTGFSKRGG